MITLRIQDDFLMKFKLILQASLLFTFPYVLFEIVAFILPAIGKLGKYVVLGLTASALVLFWFGLFFAHVYIWEQVIQLLVFEWLPRPIQLASDFVVHVKKYLNIPDYLNFFFSFHIAFGIAFQLPIIICILGILQVIQVKQLVDNWRVAVLICAIFSALLTPPDWISMIFLILPLIFLYFFSILCLYGIHRFK